MILSNRSGAVTHKDKVCVSFEFFPPKSDEMEEQLWQSISRLMPFQPEFVSVTYGAGGSTKERSLATVKRIVKETNVAPAAHLTCIDASRNETYEVARKFQNAGVRHFIALRGDPADGIGASCQPHPEGYANAAELTAGLRAMGDCEISVSAYPEKHPESPDFMTDIDMLKRKIDNGATRAITQFFFDNDHFERYVERIRKAGIYIPVIPGILPIHNFTQVEKFARMCGASIPVSLAKRFEGLENNGEIRALVASAVAAEQVMDLVDRGFEEFHFYTLNRAKLVYAICHLLGLRDGALHNGAKIAKGPDNVTNMQTEQTEQTEQTGQTDKKVA